MPAKPMFQHNYADVNSVRLHYVTVGKGKLMMFLHGFPEFWYAWKDQLIEFGRDY
jgi:pimeloyl-ACP methyl ester carboxylesterase